MSKNHLSFSEQIHALMDENLKVYPDAIKWIMEKVRQTDISKIVTEYEKFTLILSGEYIWSGSPFNPLATDSADNFIQLIKWYRDKTKCGLKEAKEECEDWVMKTYPDSPRGQSLLRRINNGSNSFS